MEKDTKSYVLGCAKSQGKIARLLLDLGEMDTKKSTYEYLSYELQLLKEEFLKDDPKLAEKISAIKKGGKINLGSCYETPFGWGSALNTPRGGWPTEQNGMVYAFDKNNDIKPLPFGRVHAKPIGLKGADSGFFKEKK